MTTAFRSKPLRATRRQVLQTAAAGGAVAAASPFWLNLARAADPPIKIGFSMALTGPLAGGGKSALIAMEIWRDDINAKGGLLGRQVEFVYYDDQTNPANVPAIYTKLLDVDKRRPGRLGLRHQRHRAGDADHHAQADDVHGAVRPRRQRGVQLRPLLPDHAGRTRRPRSTGRGASSSSPGSKRARRRSRWSAPTPNSRRTRSTGAREQRQGRPASRSSTTSPIRRRTTDFTPIVRAIQATNADLVFVGSYPPDSAGMVSAANELGLKTKLFGGGMVGLQFARHPEAASGRC